MFVGREHELSVINASYNNMLGGKGSILFLTGEAGLGKTTLVHEWQRSIEGQTLYVEAACSIPIGNVDVGSLEALQPWADVIAQLQADEEKDKKKLDLKKLIFDSAPAWAWALPIVGGIAHGAMETARLVKEQQSGHNPNAGNQQQVFQQYVNLLTKISESSPLVILLDDMHWADTSSTNLLFYLSRQIADKKILVLATYRPDEAISANKGEGHPIVKVKNETLRYGTGKEQTLGYLDGTAIHELLQKTFSGYAVDKQFENWLRKISDGNSLFVAQFVKTLYEDGHLNDAGVFTGNYDAITIPASALAVVTERMRRLEKTTKTLLSYATAEGEEFTSYVLSQLVEKPPLDLLEDLKQAQEMGMIYSKGHLRSFANKTTSVFGFSHALFHKALYDSLYIEQKEYLHQRCFELLKAEWDRSAEPQERTITLASKLLTHAEKCGETQTAAEAALAAAKTAWANYAETEALEMIAHILRLPGGSPQLLLLQTDSLILQADIYLLRGRYDESLAAAKNAYDRMQEPVDKKRSARAIFQIGNVCLKRDAFDQALDHFSKSLAIYESIGDRAGAAASLNGVGLIHTAHGAYTEALKCYEQCLALRESVGDRHLIAMSMNNIGNAYYDLGKYEEALQCRLKTLAIRESIGDRRGIASSLNNIGNVYADRGANNEALEYYTKSLAIAESIGDRETTAITLTNLGKCYMALVLYEKALDMQTRCIALSEAIGSRRIQAYGLNGAGLVYLSRGEYQQALSFCGKALALGEELPDKKQQAASLISLGEAHRKMNELPQARADLSRARKICEEINAKSLLGEILFQIGLLCEQEAAQLAGTERTKKIHEGITEMESGLAFLRDARSGNVEKFEKELARLQGSV